jgi:hypothetical protein
MGVRAIAHIERARKCSMPSHFCVSHPPLAAYEGTYNLRKHNGGAAFADLPPDLLLQIAQWVATPSKNALNAAMEGLHHIIHYIRAMCLTCTSLRDAVTLDLWTYAVKANKPPAEAIWNVLPLEKKMARSLQAHATKVTAPWAAPPLTIERKHVKGRRGRRVTVVKNLFMWYYAAKAATITAGRAESMYHLRVTERAMLPFTNKVVPPYGHTAKLYLLDDVMKAGRKKTSTKVKLGLRVLRALCRTLGIKVESQHDKVQLYKKVCARLMSVRP